MKDQNEHDFEVNEYKRKLNLMSEQVLVYEKQVGELKEENVLLVKKLESAVKDSQNIRNIMTQNITQSNEKVQAILSENQKLKDKLREVK